MFDSIDLTKKQESDLRKVKLKTGLLFYYFCIPTKFKLFNLFIINEIPQK